MAYLSDIEIAQSIIPKPISASGKHSTRQIRNLWKDQG